MVDTLILKSINGQILTDKLIISWFDANEIFITKKVFSNDRYSVEITFVDEERADMLSDLLKTCYSDYISVERPQTFVQSLDNSFDDERVPSPVHLSSTSSISSRVSCFSQRLISLDKKKPNNQTKPTLGRGRGIDADLLQNDISIEQQISEDENDSIINTSYKTSPKSSITDNNISSGFGRGRGSFFK
ncbi:unnamed protein product [Rotaria sordida]|uniref:Uncharacterized protein n=1 Tax=Rotaria sordida TaxID=392033 RepID=A0A813QSP5_9BILA|nr:unnamed protein product [Rotaria sordida]CAF0932263.1 unnamed protein product [Rotaria sordida]CAF0957486.1 unnamed protein product [Rotaria sordida]CAF1032568.1 unnamed protein product [Rotaria sordida]CAF1150117.1 unnamed protein product [Rotaria sordida]